MDYKITIVIGVIFAHEKAIQMTDDKNSWAKVSAMAIEYPSRYLSGFH